MSLTSCKRLSILFINFCILISVAQAQDSTKQVAPTTKKIVSPQKSKATTAKPKARVAIPVIKFTSDTSKTTAVISTPTVRVPQDRSLNGQYNDLIKYSWLQKNYRVLNSAKFNTLWKNVNDSVSYYKKSLAETNEKLAEQTLKFNNVQSSKNSKYNPSSNTSQPVKEIQVLGTSVDTTTYNWIMLGIIFALTFTLAIILFFISKLSFLIF